MFQDLVIRTRTFRGFDESRVIAREELLQLVELARLTASSANKQPLRYALAYEKEQVEAVLAHTRWAGALPHLHLPAEGKHPTAFIVICHDYERSANLTPYLKDVGIAAQTIMLGATEMGLGGCMIGSFNPQGVTQVLALPQGVEPQLVLALGKPAEDVRLTDVRDGQTAYYRDEQGVHYVPKRSLEEILL